MRFFAILLALVCAPLANALTTFGVSNSSFQAGLTPFCWYTSGSTYSRTINTGAQLKLNFTGTSFVLNVDVSGITESNYPTIGWSVDGGPLSTLDLNSSSSALTLASGLSDTTHTITVTLYVMYFNPGSFGRWDGAQSLTVTGVSVDTGKTISNATLPTGGVALFEGDSITEGISIPGTLNNWTFALANYMGAICSQVGFSGQKYDIATTSIPKFGDTAPYLYSGVDRPSSPPPTYVFLNEGTNGEPTAGNVSDLLTATRAKYGATTYIFQMVPFGQYNASTIITGYNNYTAGAPSDSRAILLDLGSAGATIVATNSSDGVHPNATGCALLAELLWPLVQPYVGRAVTVTNLTVGTLIIQ